MSSTKTNLLMLLRGNTRFLCENYTKHINTFCCSSWHMLLSLGFKRLLISRQRQQGSNEIKTKLLKQKSLQYTTVRNVNKITSRLQFSQTTFGIYIAKKCFTYLVLTTICFGLYNDYHQVVKFLIINQTVQYTMFLFLSTRYRSHL